MKKSLLVVGILMVTLAPTMYAFQKLNANAVLIVHIALMSLIVNYIFRKSKKEEMLLALTLSIVAPLFEGYMVHPKFFDRTVFVWVGLIVWAANQWWDVYIDRKEVNIKKIYFSIGISTILLLLKWVNII